MQFPGSLALKLPTLRGLLFPAKPLLTEIFNPHDLLPRLGYFIQSSELSYYLSFLKRVIWG